jgi:YfiH family protein
MTPFITASLNVPHGFFTREGGVSTGSFASLNCSFSGGDDPNLVHENRARAAAAIGLRAEYLLGLKQVHGLDVITVTEPWGTGQGPSADAMVTAEPGLALGVITADCAPVLFADSAGKVIGAAHAGWRGALAGVLEATIRAMQALGADHITAVIGPCIHQPSYEVAADLRGAILARNPADSRFFSLGRPGHWQFDLPGYCAARLAQIDIQAQVMPDDTCADPARFFSHRRRTLLREAAIGHQISVIKL